MTTLCPPRKFSAYATDCTSLAWISPISFFFRGVRIGRYFNIRYGRWNGKFLVWNGIFQVWNGIVWKILPAMEDGRFAFHSIVCPACRELSMCVSSSLMRARCSTCFLWFGCKPFTSAATMNNGALLSFAISSGLLCQQIWNVPSTSRAIFHWVGGCFFRWDILVIFS